MRKILPLFLLLLISSCVSRHGQSSSAQNKLGSLYSVVISTTENYNDTAKTKIVLNRMSFNPTKNIIANFSSELAESKDLIYLFTWENNLPTVTNNFKAIVVDKITGKAFYAFKSESGRNINMMTNLPNGFEVEDLIVRNYSNNKMDILRSLQKGFSSAEMGQDYFIYEVDLTNKTSKVTVLTSVAVGEKELLMLKGS